MTAVWLKWSSTFCCDIVLKHQPNIWTNFNHLYIIQHSSLSTSSEIIPSNIFKSNIYIYFSFRINGISFHTQRNARVYEFVKAALVTFLVRPWKINKILADVLKRNTPLVIRKAHTLMLISIYSNICAHFRTFTAPKKKLIIYLFSNCYEIINYSVISFWLKRKIFKSKPHAHSICINIYTEI